VDRHFRVWARRMTVTDPTHVEAPGYLVDFRGEHKAKHVHDVILWHMMK
jgi:hypothetical protein